jgi:hypothetical protein
LTLLQKLLKKFKEIFMTHGFKNGRLIAEQGTFERTGVGEFVTYDDATNTFAEYSSSGSPEGSLTANVGSRCTDITNGAQYLKASGAGNTGWVLTANGSPLPVSRGGTGATSLTDGGIMLGSGTGAVTVTGQPTNGQLLVGSTSSDPILMTSAMISVPGGWIWNLGMSLSGGVLTISGADGTALSASNPAYVVMADRSSLGLMKQYKLTANQTLTASNMTNNSWGTSAGVAWNIVKPFFIYLTVNDAQDTPIFAICDIPHRVTSTNNSALIGMPSTANATVQSSFFMFSNVTAADYNSNPCLCVGSVRMTKDSGNAWTIASLTNSCGIGRFNFNVNFRAVAGHYGAAASSYLGINAPVFTTNTVDYTFSSHYSEILVSVYLDGDGGTDGSSATTLVFYSPFFPISTDVPTGSLAQIQYPASYVFAYPVLTAGNYFVNFYDGTGTAVQYASFTNGNRRISTKYGVMPFQF